MRTRSGAVTGIPGQVSDRVFVAFETDSKQKVVKIVPACDAKALGLRHNVLRTDFASQFIRKILRMFRRYFVPPGGQIHGSTQAGFTTNNRSPAFTCAPFTWFTLTTLYCCPAG